MLFSSAIFIFAFLPGVLVLYFTILRNHLMLQNLLLLAASIGFYAWGEPKFVIVMLVSIIFNYLFARLIENSGRQGGKRIWLVASVIINIGILFVFKYLNFTVSNIDHIFGNILPQTSIELPIGISFFTFQAMSYVIDVYRGEVKAQRNIFYIALYISFFPQLVAGPIVRYKDINEQLLKRTHTIDNMAIGVRKFIAGLGKKVLVSNNLAIVADAAFDSVSRGDEISVAFAWLGAVAYMLQIYFDFDGYSQMAIGLGKMFGFDFMENFNYPYIAKSITDFWRRWHISLSTWFRDYLYIPLGGNRVKTVRRHIFNLFVVWLATGIWHGANWTFVLWGLLYFGLLVFEKYSGLYRKMQKFPGWFHHVYTLFFVNVAWVFFRSDSVIKGIDYLRDMFAGKNLIDGQAVRYFCEYKFFFVFGVLYSAAVFQKLSFKLENKQMQRILGNTAPVVYMLIFMISAVYLVTGGYNPFIYFNF